MLLPTVSVTVIGLIAGLLALVAGRSRSARALLLGVVGAWVGFLVGALIGVSVDIVVESGIYLGIVGHLRMPSYTLGLRHRGVPAVFLSVSEAFAGAFAR